MEIKYITEEDCNKINYYNDSIIEPKDYKIDDCMLVRTTDIFPFDRTIKIPNNDDAYEFDSSNILGGAIQKVLKNEYSGNTESTEYNKELKEFAVVFKTCRSTTHYCINGLVESHEYGNFDNKPFLIFEPIKYHLDPKPVSLRSEDTYYSNDIILSSESAIAISKSFFDQIEAQNNVELLEQLLKYKLYVYEGDQKVVTQFILNDLGYNAFRISEHGYANNGGVSVEASKMYNFINNYAKTNNIGQEPHSLSVNNQKDLIERSKESEKADREHLNYLLLNGNFSESFIAHVNLALSKGTFINKELDDLMDIVVSSLGLEKIKKLTKQFNDDYISKLKSSKKRLM